MSVIVGKIFSIFIIAAIGFVANRIGILPDQANKYLVDLLMLITSPCMIIASVCDTQVTDDTALSALLMGICAVAFFAAGYVLSWIICVKILKISADEGAGVYMLAMTTINNGFMGFPITYALFGDDILFLMIIFQVLLVIYSYSVGMIQVSYGSKAVATGKNLLRSLATPSTIAAGVSIIFLLLQVKLPSVLYDTIDQVGSATVPLSMIVVGMQLGSSNLSKMLNNKRLVITSVLKMLLWPTLTFLAVNWLPLSVNMKVALIFGATFPAAVLVVPIASSAGKDAVLGAEVVALTTTISVATLPLCAMFLMKFYGLV